MNVFSPRRVCVALLLSLFAAASASARTIDLSAAVVLVAPGLTSPERKAVTMLVEESERRCGLRWNVVERAPEAGQAVIMVGQHNALTQVFPLALRVLPSRRDPGPEGYSLGSDGNGTVVVAGNDERGVLFGVGRLLRQLEFRRGGVSLTGPVALSTSPKYPLRGHQLGYRPKTNSYDGWDVRTWEQCIRDLIAFGTNAIEGVPPRTDDAPDSPHFPLPPMRMMIEQSRIAHEYGIEYWIWYPAIEEDYSDPKAIDAAVAEWGEVIRQLPRLDGLFVPGGDPGSTPPRLLFRLMERQAAELRKHHPKAKLWMSPQSFTDSGMNEFFQLMAAEPVWLEGVAFGPQQRVSLDELKRRIPARYKIRFYPDITHSLNAQFPVENWDHAYAVTENRETINPRPVDHTATFRRLQPPAGHGVLTYSEGCNDDVNKIVWSMLAWDPLLEPVEMVRAYSRYFIGAHWEESFAQGLLALERNWRGPLLTNSGVDVTLRQFQAIERSAPPSLLANWRFQQALYRAYYDAFVRARLIAETAQENRAIEHLERAHAIGTIAAMKLAERELAPPIVPPAAALRARVFELAEALFQSIRMQLSVPRYKAIALERGANLDRIDYPLNSRRWFIERFAEIRATDNEEERLEMLHRVLDWQNPGPGGFYDDLGNPAQEPHLVRNATLADDPDFRTTPYAGFETRGARRVSTATYAQTLWEQPLELRYRDLDPGARYRVRFIYGGNPAPKIKLVADGRHVIHPLVAKKFDVWPQECDIPPEATSDGELRLTWHGEPGLAGNGRWAQVAEVWLVRMDDGGER